MIVDTTKNGMEEFEITDGTNRRRRVTDTTQPLDYETEELVKEYIENQQRTEPQVKSFIQKLFE
jgi:ferritin